MSDFSSGPDIRAAVDRAVSRLGEHAPAARIEREAEKILASEWRAMYGSTASRMPCRITADICVADCTSRLSETVRALLYDRIRRAGSSLASAVQSWTIHPAGRPRLHVRLPDSDVLSAGHDAGIEAVLVRVLDRAAGDGGIDMIEGPVFAMSDDRDLRLLETLPDLLRETQAVRPVLEIDDGRGDFLRDALYAVALSLLARSDGPHGVELALRTSSTRPAKSSGRRASLDVTVTAGSGADLTHAGREAYEVGRRTLDELAPSSGDVSLGEFGNFSPGRVLIALSAQHAGEIARRIPAGSVRDSLLADVPRGAAVDVVVDGYTLGYAPRNRLTLTPDTDPEQLATEIETRLQSEHTASTILLSTPALQR